MNKRECGDCTMCCDTLPVKWLNKPANTKCVHCNLGCMIQDTKEDECRNFDCEWLLDETMPENLKPEKTNVFFEKLTTKIYLATCYYTDPNAWQRPEVTKYIKELNSKGISVMTTSFTTNPKGVFLAEGHTKERVWEIVTKLNKLNNIK